MAHLMEVKGLLEGSLCLEQDGEGVRAGSNSLRGSVEERDKE